MKINTETIAIENSLHKYVMTHHGSKRWRRTFFACIDHSVITPVLNRWELIHQKRKNILTPKLLEVIVSSDNLIESNYSETDEEYRNGEKIAKELAKKTLSKIFNEEELYSLILDKEYNWAYPNLVSNDRKIIASAVIYNITEKTNIFDSIEKSESHFSRNLPSKEELLKYINNKKIDKFSEFKTKGVRLD